MLYFFSHWIRIRTYRTMGVILVFLPHNAIPCVNKHSFSLFILLVRDNHGHEVLVAYIISSSGTQETFKLALQKLQPVFPKKSR